jgi:hypothetical protein
MNDDLVKAIEHLEAARSLLTHFFTNKRINGIPRPERAGWAMTSVTHAVSYLEREVRETAKVDDAG